MRKIIRLSLIITGLIFLGCSVEKINIQIPKGPAKNNSLSPSPTFRNNPVASIKPSNSLIPSQGLTPPVSHAPEFVTTPVYEPSPSLLPTTNGNSISIPFESSVVTFYGTIYDTYKNPVSGARIHAEPLNKLMIWEYKDVITDSPGSFKFTNFPDETDIRITVSKEGYKTISREGRIKKITQPDNQNRFNFGGEGEDARFALVKIN